MNHRIGLFLLFLLVVGPVAIAQYVPPRELVRNGTWSSIPLNNFPDRYVVYSWLPQSRQVRFVIFWKPTPSSAWKSLEHTETVSYYMTAVAPLYSGLWDSLYVIGVNVDGKTIIEKWKVVITLTGGEPKVAVKRAQVLVSATLTHIRAAAAAPNDQFLIIQRHETQEILKLSLPSGVTTTLLTPAQYPNLKYYDVIRWRRHNSLGDVFCVSQGRSTDDLDHPSSILMWDVNLDGVPNSVEELTPAQAAAHGFDQGDVWQPDLTLYAPH
ncbi:MAG: hypothetical protein HY292_02800 [Planctomycetes bacterium]|nr:hypothetical protein [Planctomycetota bacterium]